MSFFLLLAMCGLTVVAGVFLLSRRDDPRQAFVLDLMESNFGIGPYIACHRRKVTQFEKKWHPNSHRAEPLDSQTYRDRMAS
jgi:hypothetical protein